MSHNLRESKCCANCYNAEDPKGWEGSSCEFQDDDVMDWEVCDKWISRDHPNEIKQTDLEGNPR